MAYLTKDAIKKADGFKTAEVEVPEWNGTVKVRELTAEEEGIIADLYMDESGNINANGVKKFRAKLVELATIGEDGERLFSQNDINWLLKKPASILERISDKIRELSGMLSEDEKAALAGEANPKVSPTDAASSSV